MIIKTPSHFKTRKHSNNKAEVYRMAKYFFISVVLSNAYHWCLHTLKINWAIKFGCYFLIHTDFFMIYGFTYMYTSIPDELYMYSFTLLSLLRSGQAQRTSISLRKPLYFILENE